MTAPNFAKADLREILLDLRVLGEILDSASRSGSPQDCDLVPTTWIGWTATSIDKLVERLEVAVGKLPEAAI